MIVYAHGELLPLERATIPVTDHGFLYGVGLFETFRSWNGGHLFLLERHLSRLLKGCELLGIDASALRLANETSLRHRIAELLERNGMDDAVFRYTVSAGEPPNGGLPRGRYTSPREMLLVRPLPGSLSDPSTLHVLKTRRTPPETSSRIKSFHYFNSLSGYRELWENGAAAGDEGIMLTPDGRVAEGTTTNIFVIQHGKLKTPPPDTGLLPGIARGAVIELAAKAGVACEETNLDAEDLWQAEAAFATNAVIGIRPAGAISDAANRKDLPLDGDHPVVRLLRQGWNRCLDRATAIDWAV